VANPLGEPKIEYVTPTHVLARVLPLARSRVDPRLTSRLLRENAS
jgi:hypothetical protein